jgi:DNA-binding protein YbaB
MLDKLKQLGQLKAMQDELKAAKFEHEQDGVKIVIDGSLTIQEVTLSKSLSPEEGGQIIKNCFNEAVKKAQYSMAKRFSGLI